MESEIVIDDCNKHAQTSKSTISYEHVNFCEALRIVKRIKSKKNIVSTIGMKKLECGTRLRMSSVKRLCPLSFYL
jgi:hypothetical protein